MTSDDANVLPLQTEGLNHRTPKTPSMTDRDERLQSATPIVRGTDRADPVGQTDPTHSTEATDPTDATDATDRASQIDQAVDQAERIDQINPIDPIGQAEPVPQVELEQLPQEPEIVPQPAPSCCSACGQSHWELYAHLPIETDAYLAAAAELNHRSRTKKPKTKKPKRPKAIVEQRNRNTPPNSSQNTSPSTPEDNAPSPGLIHSEEVFEVKDADTPISLSAYPHGTAWRCYDCGALALVWPIDSEPIAKTITQPSRRRSSVEFRESIKHQLDDCLRVKTLGSRSAATVKRLRVLDLNLGRGTRAERNLALLHELGLAKHQIFGIGDDRSTINRLNFAGYQAYCGTIDRVLDELPEEHFDLVLGFNLIEYLPNPGATLQQLTTKLRPGARLLLELSNPESWQARLFRHGYWASYQRDRRLLLGEKALRILGKRCQFAIDHLKAYPEIQAWETSAAAWTRRKRHPLRGMMGSRLMRGTLVGLDRLRAALGMAASRYGAVLVFEPSRVLGGANVSIDPIGAIDTLDEIDPINPIAPDLTPEFGTNPTHK